MSEKEEIEEVDLDEHKETFEDHHYSTTQSEMDQEADDDEPRVHFKVIESDDGERYRIVRKPSKPKSSLARHNPNKNRRSSAIWNKFTIIDHVKCIALCNICRMKLSFKSTVSNLRNHLNRRHNRESMTEGFRHSTKFEERHRPKPSIPAIKKKSLTELGGLEGLILNVVGEEGDPLNTEGEEAVEESVVYTTEGEFEDYQTEEQTPASETVSKRKVYRPQPTSHRVDNASDQVKRSRILDLQLECLEMKKYTMQMEALVLEQQLNLPRSLYTESLREVDVWTRGTQTDVGGDNTKVFYVSDNAGESQGPHLFSFRARHHE